MNGASTDNLDLAKPSSLSNAPKSRLENAGRGAEIAARLIENARERNRKAANIMGMIDGNPPYPPSKLKQNAQDWRGNFNTLEGESLLANACTPFYDLFSSAFPMVDVVLDTKDARQARWSRIVSEEFHRFFYEYASVEFILWKKIFDFVGFGKAYLYWPDMDDPFFKHVPWHRVLFPNATNVDPDDWELFAIRQRYTVSQLWGFIRNGGMGWNKTAVLNAIQNAKPFDPQGSQAEQVELQQELRDSDLYVSTRTETVPCISLFVREFDGKWSHYMLEENAISKGGESGKVAAEYLFKRLSAWDAATQIIAPFFYDVGTGSINGLGGLGRKVFQIIQTKDRLWMSTIDGAFLRAYPLVQGADASSVQRGGIMQLGPMHILAPGVNLQQTNLLADIAGPLAVNQALDSLVEGNISIFKPRLEKPRGNPETATAASLRYQNATVLTNSAVNRYYQQLDRFLEELWRRAVVPHQAVNLRGLKAAAEFRRRCADAGVPKKVLETKPFSLTATRVIGNGSPFVRQQAVVNLSAISSTFGPQGRKNFTEDFVSAYAGYGKVRRYMPDEDLMEVPGVQDWMAKQEETDMAQGVAPIISEGQNHIVHLRSHTRAIAASIQSVEQGANPMSVLGFVQTALAHSAAHLEYLNEAEQKTWERVLKELAKASMEVREKVEQGQEQQAQQAQRAQQMQQMGADQEVKMMQARHKMALSEMKAMEQMKTKRQQSDLNTELAVGKFNLDDAKTASEISRQEAKSRSDMSIAEMQARAKARQQNSGNKE